MIVTGSHVVQAGFELTVKLKLAPPWDCKFAPPYPALSPYLISSAATRKSCHCIDFMAAEISRSKCHYQ